MIKQLLSLAIFILFIAGNVSALAVKNVDADVLAPGKEGTISVELENELDDTVTDVSLSLTFATLPFRPVGSSQVSIDEIEDGDEETFDYTIKASNDVVPGDYQIPYILSYMTGNERKQVSGTVGITVSAEPELVVTLSEDKAIVGKQGKISLKVVNKGFADARFVSMKLKPSGYTLLSDDEVYIGTVDSDDFETANFDVLFTKSNPTVSVDVEYVDFNNKRVTTQFRLPVTVYTQEKAKELGLIKQSYTGFIILGIVILLILWLVVRSVRKRKRLRQSMSR